MTGHTTTSAPGTLGAETPGTLVAETPGGAPDPATVVGPPPKGDRATRLRRRAAWTLTVGIGVSALVVLALSATTPAQALDPDDAGPDGGKALVQVLREHGVVVQVVRSVQGLVDASPGSGTTVVVGNPAYLGHDSTDVLRATTSAVDRLVLMSPTADQLETLDLPITSGSIGAPVTVTAGCRSTVARPDDTASPVDTRFVPFARGSGPAATWCFALPDPRAAAGAQGAADFRFGAAMATVPAGAAHPEVVALGFADGFTNRWVADESHAGLAIRALGGSPRLVWYQPGIGDLASQDGSATSAWPVWLGPAGAILATAVIVLALVRGRRMGALVSEPLPVVVRAVETTESRGRIYRRARDRSRAAAVLRLGSTDRLARRLALPPHASSAVQAAAAAASGMPPAQVASLLAGPPPTTDAELHTLANALADLEERVRTS